MGSTGPSAAILKVNLGPASAFDRRIFPVAYDEAGDNFSKGKVLIKATLEEMESIKQLGIDLNSNDDFIFNTRRKLEDLRAKGNKLQDETKTFNPFKVFRNYRIARLFHEGSKALFLQTKRTSEQIHRDAETKGHVQVVPRDQIREVDNTAPLYFGEISGVVVELPDGYSDNAEWTINGAKEAIATNGSPFLDDPLITQLGDDEHAISLANTASLLGQDSVVDENNTTPFVSNDPLQSRPTSPLTINHYHIYQHSIVTTNSNLSGVTMNRGSRDTGASVIHDQVSTP